MTVQEMKTKILELLENEFKFQKEKLEKRKTKFPFPCDFSSVTASTAYIYEEEFKQVVKDYEKSKTAVWKIKYLKRQLGKPLVVSRTKQFIRNESLTICDIQALYVPKIKVILS